MGWFTTDATEPGAAYEEQVLAGGSFPGPDGLEIVTAGPNLGLRPGLRAMKASTRIDIPTLWRAVLRRPISVHDGAIVSILPPRGVAPSAAEPTLAAAGVQAPTMVAGPGALDCLFEVGTTTGRLVDVRGGRAAGAGGREHRRVAVDGPSRGLAAALTRSGST